jgi:hypothetical protein
MEVSGQLHAPASLSPGQSLGINCIGGWWGPRSVVKYGENKNLFPLRGIESRSFSQEGSHYTNRAIAYYFQNIYWYFNERQEYCKQEHDILTSLLTLQETYTELTLQLNSSYKKEIVTLHT